MKYFIDTEFIEGFHKPLFGKRRHFIDLISIGIVAEDGREYYAISNEFNPKDADKWVTDNVISKLPQRKVSFYDSPRMRQESLLWKSNERIAKEIIDFINPPVGAEGYIGWIAKHNPILDGSDKHGHTQPEFYGYYSDYDWVLFCSLFGRMIDLPKGFPMYCQDLKQTLDYHIQQRMDEGFNKAWINPKTQQVYDASFEQCLERFKNFQDYPKQTNEHHALADAKWNRDLYLYLEARGQKIIS